MNSLPVPQARMHPPRGAADVVARPRLIASIERSLAAPLMLLVAPAGFGKTTVLSSWAATSNRHVAWMNVTARDNERAEFCRALLTAMRVAIPGFTSAVERLLGLETVPSATYLAEALADDLAALAVDLVLVLDTYEQVRSADVDEIVVGLVECASSRVNLIVASRTEPIFPLSLLRAHGQVAELGPNQLAFTQQEATEFVRTSAAQRLDDEVVKALVESARGWPAALRLLTTLAGEGASHAAVPQEGLSEAVVHQLLVDEVLLRQDPIVRDFLLETAVPERFSLSLREALSEGPLEAQEQRRALEQILRSHLFVTPLDADGVWFEYHTLLRETLLPHLVATRGVKAVQALHRRAAVWFENQGFFVEAVHHALQSGDEMLLVELVETNMRALLDQDHAATLDHLLLLLPDGMLDRHPALLLAWCWVMSVRMSFATIEGTLTRVDRLAAAPELAGPQVRTELDVLRATVAFSHSHFAQARVLAWRSLSDERLFPFAQRHALTIWSLACHACGDGEAAVAYLSGLLDTVPLRSADVSVQLVAFVLLAALHLLRGDLDAVGRLAAFEVRRAAKLDLRVLEGWGHYMLARMHLLRNEVQEAADHFRGALQGGSRTNGLVLREAHLGLVLCQQSLGAPQDAKATLAAAGRLSEETPGFDPDDEIGSMQRRLALLRGESLPAPRTERPLRRRTLFERTCVSVEHPLLTRGFTLVAAGDSTSVEQAVTLGADLVAQRAALHDTPGLVAALILRASAQQASGDEAGSLQALGRAIETAAPGRITRPFVEAGSAIRVLLPQVPLARADECAFRDHLVQHFGPPSEPVRSTPTQHLLDAQLTWREVQVLELLDEHLTNREIADLLIISTETVKRHVRNICRKLGVRTRREAVAQGKRLALDHK